MVKKEYLHLEIANLWHEVTRLQNRARESEDWMDRTWKELAILQYQIAKLMKYNNREGGDAIQEREATAMAVGEPTGPGPEVDSRVRIGGVEEEKAEEEKGYITSYSGWKEMMLTTLGNLSTEESSNGDQENEQQSDDDQPGGFHAHRITGRFGSGTTNKTWTGFGPEELQNTDEQAGSSRRISGGE